MRTDVMEEERVKDFEELLARATGKGSLKISVAFAQDDDVLKAVKAAHEKGLVNGYLVGDEAEIKKIAAEIDFDLTNFEIVDEKEKVAACEKAVRLVSEGKADILMKGLVDTAVVLKAVLNKEFGLRTGSVLSHVAAFHVPTYHKIFLITDAAMNIAPDVNGKKQIVQNALVVAEALEIKNPNVAVVCAKEKVTESMQATVDAGELVRMNEAGELGGCRVGGPFGLDNVISKRAADIKGIKDEMAGNADILLLPNIESGNVLYKSLIYFAEAKSAGTIVGAKAPIVLTSRADSDELKLYSIALAVLMAWRKK